MAEEAVGGGDAPQGGVPRLVERPVDDLVLGLLKEWVLGLRETRGRGRRLNVREVEALTRLYTTLTREDTRQREDGRPLQHLSLEQLRTLWRNELIRQAKDAEVISVSGGNGNGNGTPVRSD